MGEQLKPPEKQPPARAETPEQTMERLRPIFQASLDVYNNPERPLVDGAITVSRRRANGEIETIHTLIVVDIDEDGPNLAAIDEEGNPTSSASMLWKELTDAHIENS